MSPSDLVLNCKTVIFFCERERRSIFERKVWSESKSGEGAYGRVRLARFTREDHAYGASRLSKTSENDCFAV